MSKKLVILGAEGQACNVFDSLFYQSQAANEEYDILGFIVEKEYGKSGNAVYAGRSILGDLDWLAKYKKEVLVVNGLVKPAIIRKLTTAAKKAGAQFHTLIEPSAIVSPSTILGEGVIIRSLAIITPNCRIGNFAVINTYSSVGHDNVLEDYVVMPGRVTTAGYVTIKEGVFVGMGGVIGEKVTIGSWATVGGLAFVNKDVPANSTAVGIPAKVVKTKPVGWHLSGGETGETE
jgi:sugar O-acyltransferase (sialic acid O-acetyltransferase NeuD family)